MHIPSKRTVLSIVGVLAVCLIVWLGWRYWSQRPDSRLEDGTPVYGLSSDDKALFAEQLSKIPLEKRTLTAQDKQDFLDSLAIDAQ